VTDVHPELDALHLDPPRGGADPSVLRSLGLTKRQAQVLALAAGGRTTPQIAAVLKLSARTVEKHFEAIYDRLRVTGRTQAVLAAASCW
jgi:DNA-binding NarL/FixJ family response regulator